MGEQDTKWTFQYQNISYQVKPNTVSTGSHIRLPFSDGMVVEVTQFREGVIISVSEAWEVPDGEIIVSASIV
jgi:hypothetical protein